MEPESVYNPSHKEDTMRDIMAHAKKQQELGELITGHNDNMIKMVTYFRFYQQLATQVKN